MMVFCSIFSTLLGMPQLTLEFVQIIIMSSLCQDDNPIIKAKHHIYHVDYSDDTNNIEVALRNENIFDIYKVH